jgi:hypothetical protein
MINVSVVEERSRVVITDGDKTTTVITAPSPGQISVKFPGPAGPAGATGPQGPQGLPGDGVAGNNDVGVLYLKNNSIVTDISAPNQRAVVAGTMLVGELYNFVKDAETNSLKYQGPGGLFHVVATFNFYSGSQDVCGFYVGHNTDDTTALDPNGNRISESEVYANAGTPSAQPVSAAVQTVLSLSPGDRLFFIVQNQTSAKEILVEFLKFIAISLVAEKGDTGEQGLQGIPGAGVPAGGEPGQIIEKVGEGDYETAWTDPLSPSLQGLSDVDVSDKQDNSVLYYSLSSDKWKSDGVNTLVSLSDGGNF